MTAIGRSLVGRYGSDGPLSHRVTFRVLGPVEVIRDGQPVLVRGQTTLTLLACLLLSANEVVPVAALIESAWGAKLPAHPRAALHNGISRLRSTCGDDRIETLAWGYRLHGDADTIDVLRFTALTGAADRALHAGKPEVALAALDEAVGLWREPLLGNVDSPGLHQDVVPSLTERYLRALEERAELCLRLRREASIVEQLPTVLKVHPFRERMVRQLMIALVRTGRQAQALAVYGRLRDALGEELGIQPGAQLQELFLRILRADSSLD